MSEQEKPSYVWEVQYENYVDFFWMGHKRGMIILAFGQAIHSPPKLLVRLWIDIDGARAFYSTLGKWLESYEKAFEKPPEKQE